MSRFLDESFQSLELFPAAEQSLDPGVIKLNANEFPFSPAPGVLDVLSRADADQMRLYPDPDCRSLRRHLADLHGLQPEQVFPASGSDHIISVAMYAYGGDGAAYPDLSCGLYSILAGVHRLDRAEIPLKGDFSLDYRDYCGLNRMIILANPNTPTGCSIPLRQIEAVVRSNPDHVVLIDEAYVDFGAETCLPLVRRYENLLIVRTFSKSRGLAGARLGYALGCPALISDLERVCRCSNPYRMNRLCAALGEAAADSQRYYQRKWSELVRIRQWTALQLENLDFIVLPSDSNFLFAAHPKISGEALYCQLKSRGILVRHFENKRIRNFNRISIGTQAQMQTLIDQIQTILEQGS